MPGLLSLSCLESDFLGVKTADKPGNVTAEEPASCRRWQLSPRVLCCETTLHVYLNLSPTHPWISSMLAVWNLGFHEFRMIEESHGMRIWRWTPKTEMVLGHRHLRVIFFWDPYIQVALFIFHPPSMATLSVGSFKDPGTLCVLSWDVFLGLFQDCGPFPCLNFWSYIWIALETYVW